MRLEQFSKVRGVHVDLEALVSVSHRCEPTLCKRGGSCCGCYDVWLDEAEVDRIVDLMPHAAQFARHLRTEDGFDNVFEQTSLGFFTIDTDEDGLCAFAYRGGKGTVLCSLHSAGLALDLDPTQAKPRSCALWPLAMPSARPPILTVQDDAFSFPCNAKRSGAFPLLDDGVAAIIAGLFDDDFLDALNEELRKSQRVP